MVVRTLIRCWRDSGLGHLQTVAASITEKSGGGQDSSGRDTFGWARLSQTSHETGHDDDSQDHDPDHEEALPRIENIAEMKQRVELGPAEPSRPVEIDPASKEDIAI